MSESKSMLEVEAPDRSSNKGSNACDGSEASTDHETVLTIDIIDNMLVKDLRRALELRGQKSSGRKAELQKRLKETLCARSDENASKTNCVDQNKKKEYVGALNSSKAKRVDPVDDDVDQKQVKAAGGKAGAGITPEQRANIEANRRRALEIRATKKLKVDAATAVAVENPIVTPGSASAKKTPFNPYKMAATSTSIQASVTPQMKCSSASNPKSVLQVPPVTSMWGDCRLDLWEALCTCGGERKAPDVRMCSCPGAYDAGLGCEGCNAGVLLIKSGPRGNFWGCSQYKKRGCKFTKRFGSPHDAEAARQLAAIKQRSMQQKKREMEEWSRMADPFEQDWRSNCHCGGAKHLDTFECFMRSEGGCGFLPICPQGCGGQLFLHQSKYGTGRWWGCSNFKKGLCKFRRNYMEHH
ncbi:hypothetical protein ACHAWF_003705 [Thalassiosira exigua]